MNKVSCFWSASAYAKESLSVAVSAIQDTFSHIKTK